jgi:hypothetical protein
MSQPCVWLHDASLRPTDPALVAHPNAAVVFVFDEPALRAEPIAFHRLDFVFQTVCELWHVLPNPHKEVRRGPLVAEIVDFCRSHGCDHVCVTDHPAPSLRQAIAELRTHLRVDVLARPQMAEYTEEPKRFSRYWERVAPQILGYPPRTSPRRMR